MVIWCGMDILGCVQSEVCFGKQQKNLRLPKTYGEFLDQLIKKDSSIELRLGLMKL
jgi:hypothetical protein